MRASITRALAALPIAALAAAGCSSGGGTDPGSAANAPPGAERSASEDDRGRFGAGDDGRFVGTATLGPPPSSAFEFVEWLDNEVVVVISDGRVAEVAMTLRYRYRTCQQVDGVTLVCTIELRNSGEMTGGEVDISNGSASVPVRLTTTSTCDGPEFECKDHGERETYDATLALTVADGGASGPVTFDGFEVWTVDLDRA